MPANSRFSQINTGLDSDGFRHCRHPISTHMHDWTSRNVSYGFSQYLMCQRSSVAFSQKKKAEDIGHGVPFFPFEINMRNTTAKSFDVNEERRDRVRNDGTPRAQNAMVVQSFSADLQLLGKLGCIGQFHLDENDLGSVRKAMDVTHQRVDSVEIP